MPVDYRILGPFEAAHAGQSAAIAAAKERALIIRLLLEDGRAVSVDRLVEDLWEGDPPESAGLSVRVHVSRVRKALAKAGAAGAIETRQPGYALVLGEHDSVDAHRFEQFVEQGRRELKDGDDDAAAATLGAALRLWRGRALAEVADFAFARVEAARLEEMRLSALEDRIEADLRRGLHGPLAAELAALVAEYPLRERLWGQLMLALYRSGRQSEALARYQMLRRMLDDELGLEPSPQIAALHDAILRQASELSLHHAATAIPDDLPTGVVTFMLTDIEGSVTMWELQPTRMAEALEQHDAIIAAQVSAAGGRLIKSKGEGDAALAVFQRASDAAHAAVALQTAIEQYAWPDALRIRVRIGIHTGEAYERGGDYFGPAVNRAARLRALAHGGQTLLSQATMALVADDLPADSTLVDVGRRSLRGMSHEEHVFELVRAGTQPHTPKQSAHEPLSLPSALVTAPTPFVGREEPLDTLDALWKETLAGRQRAALIAGDPGIGKTRFVAELAARVHEHGATVLHGRCDEHLSVPYQPFVEALQPYVETAPAAALRELGAAAGDVARVIPEIAERVGALPAPPRLDPELERLRLFGGLTKLLATAAADRPLLLVLDDLHWATKPTLLLLRHVLRSNACGRMLITGTYRRSELDRSHPLAEVLADLRRIEGVVRVALGGLDLRSVTGMLEAEAGHELDERALDLAAALHAETEGNPFYVLEVVRHLEESGAIRRIDGHFTTDVTEASHLGLPESIREVITRRLSRLSDTANRALAMGSLIGASFSLQVLDRALGPTHEPDALLDAIDEAVTAEILVEDSPVEYSFTHALVRQTLSAELTSARRARMHRRIGEAIESMPGTDQHVEALAHHFSEAALDGQAEKAAVYALAAARRAVERLALEEAIRHLERGRAVIELEPAAGAAPVAGGGGVERELTLLLADLYDLTGSYERAHALYEGARLSGGGVRAWAGCAAMLRKRGQVEAADALVGEAFAQQDRIDGWDPVPLRLQQGWALTTAGRYRDAIAALRRGLDEAGDRAESDVGHLLLRLSRVETIERDLDSALAHALEARRLFESIEDMPGVSKSAPVIAAALQLMGRLDEAVEVLRAGLELCERIGGIEDAAGCLINLGVIEVDRGNLDAAVEWTLIAVERFERIGNEIGKAIGYGNAAGILLQAQRTDEAATWCERALEQARSITHLPTLADAGRTMAQIRLAQGRYPEAAEAASEAARNFEAMGQEGQAGECRALAEQARRSEKPDKSVGRGDGKEPT